MARPNPNPRMQRGMRASRRSGYVMLVALILISLITVLGTTTLSLAGVDHRIAIYNRHHMVILNASHAGTVHARNVLESEDPPNENLDSSGDTWPEFVQASEGESHYGGISFNQNLGVYWVEAVYQKCAPPPPGYSTEQGNQHFRADFWNMESMARMQDSSYEDLNETQAQTIATVRKVVHGPCKIR